MFTFTSTFTKLAFAKVRRLSASMALIAALTADAFPWATPSAAAAGVSGAAGAVYVLTNATAGNAVAVFDRAGDGTLSFNDYFATGGTGTGGALGSQGALTLSRDGQRLFAVNAGSNEVSAFAVTATGLLLTSTVSSGGVRPISVTSHDGLVYVLNAGSSSIAGFAVDQNGALTPVHASTQALSSNTADGAQIQFSPDGRVLVVTEKGTNSISTFTVGSDGRAGNRQTYPSSGATPFGFDFDQNNTLFISEAPGSAASSYAAGDDGALTPISRSVPDKQAAACWLVVTNSARLAFVANAGSDSISSYRIGPDGKLSLAYDVARALPAGTGPLDLGLSRDSQYLYQLGGRAHTLTGLRVNVDGSLSPVQGGLPIPTSAVGVAAR